MSMCECFVEGWRVTAIIISVTHHCWEKEREEEELHSHAVERERERKREGVKTKKGFHMNSSSYTVSLWKEDEGGGERET